MFHASKRTVLTLGMLVAVLMLPVVGDEAQEQASRRNLQILGEAIRMHLTLNNARLPARLSELYKQGLVGSLRVFVSPSSGKTIVRASQIDELTDYACATELSKPPMKLLWERYGLHDGKALVYHSDGTFTKIAAPAAPDPPPLDPMFTSPQIEIPSSQERREEDESEASKNGTTARPDDRLFTERLAEWGECSPFPQVSNPGNYPPPSAGTNTSPDGATGTTAATESSTVKDVLKQAKAAYERGDYVQSWKLYKQAADMDATNAEAHNGMGGCLARQGDWSAAEVSFRMADRCKPNNYLYLAHIAIALMRQSKNLDEAVQLILHAIDLKPDVADLHYQHAGILRHQKRYADSETAYGRAIQLDPNKAHYYADMAESLLEQNKLDEASQAVAQAKDLGLNDHFVYERVAELDDTASEGATAQATLSTESVLSVPTTTPRREQADLIRERPSDAEDIASLPVPPQRLPNENPPEQVERLGGIADPFGTILASTVNRVVGGRETVIKGPGTFEIRIPADAVSESISIAIEQRSVAQGVAGPEMLGSIWTIRINGLNQFTFSVPIRLLVPFDPAQMRGRGRDKMPGIGLWQNGQWWQVAGVSMTRGGIIAKTRDAGTYAVVLLPSEHVALKPANAIIAPRNRPSERTVSERNENVSPLPTESREAQEQAGSMGTSKTQTSYPPPAESSKTPSKQPKDSQSLGRSDEKMEDESTAKRIQEDHQRPDIPPNSQDRMPAPTQSKQSDNAPVPVEKLEPSYDNIEKLLTSDHLEKALDLSRHLLKEKPRDFKVQMQSLRLEILCGDLKIARKQASRLLMRHPTDPNVMILKGQASLRSGNSYSAKDLFNKVLEIRPGLDKQIYQKAMEYHGRGLFKQASLLFATAATMSPEEYKLGLYYQADCAEHIGNEKEAARLYLKFMLNDPPEDWMQKALTKLRKLQGK